MKTTVQKVWFSVECGTVLKESSNQWEDDNQEAPLDHIQSFDALQVQPSLPAAAPEKTTRTIQQRVRKYFVTALATVAMFLPMSEVDAAGKSKRTVGGSNNAAAVHKLEQKMKNMRKEIKFFNQKDDEDDQNQKNQERLKNNERISADLKEQMMHSDSDVMLLRQNEQGGFIIPQKTLIPNGEGIRGPSLYPPASEKDYVLRPFALKYSLEGPVKKDDYFEAHALTVMGSDIGETQYHGGEAIAHVRGLLDEKTAVEKGVPPPQVEFKVITSKDGINKMLYAHCVGWTTGAKVELEFQSTMWMTQGKSPNVAYNQLPPRLQNMSHLNMETYNKYANGHGNEPFICKKVSNIFEHAMTEQNEQAVMIGGWMINENKPKGDGHAWIYNPQIGVQFDPTWGYMGGDTPERLPMTIGDKFFPPDTFKIFGRNIELSSNGLNIVQVQHPEKWDRKLTLSVPERGEFADTLRQMQAHPSPAMVTSHNTFVQQRMDHINHHKKVAAKQ